jgi:TatA/E family protein of Tat protein translocase
MFGIGMPEMILILAVALIVIGPKKLPDLAKSLGRAMGEFKKATSDFKETMAIDSEIKEVKETIDEIGDDLKDSMTFEAEPSGETEMDLQSASSENDDPTPETDPEKAEGSKLDA